MTTIDDGDGYAQERARLLTQAVNAFGSEKFAFGALR